MKYEPRNFSDLFALPMGGELWSYLQRPALILAMEVATKLHRPAVEAIGEDLIREFGDSVRERRIKQMIGHMVRQLLESRGYALDAQRVLVRFDELFSTGSRYRRAQEQETRVLELKPADHSLEQPTPHPTMTESEETEKVFPSGGWAAWGGTELG